jgi:hypothetical protein
VKIVDVKIEVAKHLIVAAAEDLIVLLQKPGLKD